MKLFYLVYFSENRDELEELMYDMAIHGGEFKSCKFINVK